MLSFTDSPQPIRANSVYGGNCTPNEYDLLEDSKGQAYRNLRKCTTFSNEIELYDRMMTYKNCANAREKL
jgi:hypothetical protein